VSQHRQQLLRQPSRDVPSRSQAWQPSSALSHLAAPDRPRPATAMMKATVTLFRRVHSRSIQGEWATAEKPGGPSLREISLLSLSTLCLGFHLAAGSFQSMTCVLSCDSGRLSCLRRQCTVPPQNSLTTPSFLSARGDGKSQFPTGCLGRARSLRKTQCLLVGPTSRPSILLCMLHGLVYVLLRPTTREACRWCRRSGARHLSCGMLTSPSIV
jgi:hypothetical protein